MVESIHIIKNKKKHTYNWIYIYIYIYVEKNTLIEFKVEFSRVGSALVPTYASPSIDKFSNRTSIFGMSIPTLKVNSDINSKLIIELGYNQLGMAHTNTIPYT